MKIKEGCRLQAADYGQVEAKGEKRKEPGEPGAEKKLGCVGDEEAEEGAGVGAGVERVCSALKSGWNSVG